MDSEDIPTYPEYLNVDVPLPTEPKSEPLGLSPVEADNPLTKKEMQTRAEFQKKLNTWNDRIFLDFLEYRRSIGQDSIIYVVGQKRTGKSWGAMKIAEMIDRNWDQGESLFFEARPFLKYFKDNENKIIVFDEGSES